MNFTVDGRQAFVYTGPGDISADRPSVLFVHGAGLDHSVWGLQSRYFCHHGYNVLAVDLPGHGRSEGDALGVAESAAWLGRLLDAAGVEQAMVVGHSFGALVALEFAGSRPKRVSMLALLGVAAPMQVADGLLAAARDDHEAAVDTILSWGHSAGAQLGGNPNPGMWMVGAGRRLLARARPGVLHADLLACREYRNAIERMRAVTSPVMLILGGRDRMTPLKLAQDLAGAAKQVTVTVLDDCGHMLMPEDPNGVLNALIRLVGDTPVAVTEDAAPALPRSAPAARAREPAATAARIPRAAFVPLWLPVMLVAVWLAVAAFQRQFDIVPRTANPVAETRTVESRVTPSPAPATVPVAPVPPPFAGETAALTPPAGNSRPAPFVSEAVPLPSPADSSSSAPFAGDKVPSTKSTVNDQRAPFVSEALPLAKPAGAGADEAFAGQALPDAPGPGDASLPGAPETAERAPALSTDDPAPLPDPGNWPVAAALKPMPETAGSAVKGDGWPAYATDEAGNAAGGVSDVGTPMWPGKDPWSNAKPAASVADTPDAAPKANPPSSTPRPQGAPRVSSSLPRPALPYRYYYPRQAPGYPSAPYRRP